MPDLFEDAVQTYLTCDGAVFISPQFEVFHDSEKADGGASPDFVALDFSRSPKEIVVVEVSAASNWRSLATRIEERDRRWFQPIMRILQKRGVADDSWKIRFLGFVREEVLDAIRSQFQAEDDVAFVAIEDATFSYRYWEDRTKNGLPR